MNTYELGVVPIPTNKPVCRADQADLIYKGEVGKFDAVVEDIAERHETGQPVLVGTVSVEKSEYLSRQLPPAGHPARGAQRQAAHPAEAQIVAQAGRLHSVTVATNMAGRGVDIILGGNPEVMARHETLKEGHADGGDASTSSPCPCRSTRCPRTSARPGPRRWPATTSWSRCTPTSARPRATTVRELGGLYVIGSERHESRRIDNQLRGRSGRQGDPGESRFYLSPRRRADAPVRHRRAELRDEQGAARRRGDRSEDGHQGHRAGPDHGRDAQRRDPQERPQVRRGDERAAQGDLRAPRPDPRGRRPQVGRDGVPVRGRRRLARHLLRQPGRRRVGPRRPVEGPQDVLAHVARRAGARRLPQHAADRRAGARRRHRALRQAGAGAHARR